MARLLHLSFNPVTCPGGDSSPDEGTDGTAKQGPDQSTGSPTDGGSDNSLFLLLAHASEGTPLV